MFETSTIHQVVIDQQLFTERLKEDTLERLAALYAKNGRGSNAFNGNTVPATIDSIDVRLSILAVSYPDESLILGGIVGVATWYDGQRILFDVKIEETPDGRFRYNAVQWSFRIDWNVSSIS